MSDDLKSARHWAHEMMESAVFPGARAVDATMGNGHDTLWLLHAVGNEGFVYAFDVQKQTVAHTRAAVEAEGYAGRCELILDGHERMDAHISAPVDAILFNLGWLPGGEKSVTTRVNTTLQAVEAGARLLAPKGLMTICVYPGHEEGAREREALLGWAERLDPVRFDVLQKRYLNQKNDPPELIAIRRR